MKNYLFLFFPFFINVGYCQKEIKFTEQNWGVGVPVTIKGNTIIRVEGANDEHSTTNIKYESYEQLVASSIKRADEEMWAEEKKKKNLTYLENKAIGGYLVIFVERQSITTANSNAFTVIIKDTLEQELYRNELLDQIPEVPKRDLWYNTDGFDIPVKINNRFFVYVIDKFGGEKKRYKFEVKL